MAYHPINMTVRFILELSSICIYAIWGFHQTETWIHYLLAALLPIAAAVIWGVFAVPNDPSRSGKTVIHTPGYVRLLIEISVFVTALWCLWDLHYMKLFYSMLILLTVHHIASIERINWLIKQK